jgi:Siphovirus Gp157
MHTLQSVDGERAPSHEAQPSFQAEFAAVQTVESGGRALRSPAARPIHAETELRAFEALKRGLEAYHASGEDPELLFDLAEGSTSLIEALDLALAADLDDEALIEGLRSIKQSISARALRIEKRRQARRTILEQCLFLLERKKLERPAATLILAVRQPSLEVEDESVIPARYFAMKPALDRGALRAALEAGEHVEGARLSEGATTITIRRR